MALRNIIQIVWNWDCFAAGPCLPTAFAPQTNLLEAPSRQSSETRGRIRNASAESRLTRLKTFCYLCSCFKSSFTLLGFSRILACCVACKDFGCPFRTFVTWTQELLGSAFYTFLRFTLCPVGSTRHSVLDPNLFDDSKLKVGLSFSNKLCKAVMEILGSVSICQGSVAVLKLICQRCFPSNSSECCSCVYLSCSQGSLQGALQQVNWGLLRQWYLQFTRHFCPNFSSHYLLLVPPERHALLRLRAAIPVRQSIRSSRGRNNRLNPQAFWNYGRFQGMNFDSINQWPAPLRLESCYAVSSACVVFRGWKGLGSGWLHAQRCHKNCYVASQNCRRFEAPNMFDVIDSLESGSRVASIQEKVCWSVCIYAPTLCRY